MMFQLVNALGTPGVNVSKRDAEDFRRLYLASHYIALAGEARASHLKDLAAQQLTSALRYAGLIPADRVGHKCGGLGLSSKADAAVDDYGQEPLRFELHQSSASSVVGSYHALHHVLECICHVDLIALLILAIL
jgi:hypothetical protein